MAEMTEIKKAEKKPLPTGQVLAIMGLKYRTLYNYLHDFGEFFSDEARAAKRGKRWTAEDISKIQVIRHLHSERRGKEDIRAALADGYKPPLDGLYKPEDINRLIEAAWLLLEQAEQRLDITEKLFKRCEFCEFDARYNVNKFLETIYRYKEFEHELKQIKMIVGPLKDTHKARQERDEEYERLHRIIRFHFLAEEDRRVKIEQARMDDVEDRQLITKWVRSKFKVKQK
jgi:hypothetical protein